MSTDSNNQATGAQSVESIFGPKLGAVAHEAARQDNSGQKHLDPADISPGMALGIGPDRPLSDTGRYVQAGQELAALFKDRSVHPVVIVGGIGSGKTTLLASLMRYLRYTEGSGCVVDLASDLYPSGNEIWERQLKWAEQLLEATVVSFSQSNAPPPTSTKEPFFVPLIIRRSNGETARVAFLESMGELYMLNKQGDSPHKKFHIFLSSFLNTFTNPVSIVYVTPLVSGEGGSGGAIESSQSKELLERDIAMFGVMGQYVDQRRGAYHNDRHLLLMTKWDVQFRTLSEGGLDRPTTDQMADAFRARYPKTWAQYTQLPFPQRSENKKYAVYSAGMMFESRVLASSVGDRPILDGFPRKLWNWLWKGATGGGVLYVDQEPHKLNFLDRVGSWLRGR